MPILRQRRCDTLRQWAVAICCNDRMTRTHAPFHASFSFRVCAVHSCARVLALVPHGRREVDASEPQQSTQKRRHNGSRWWHRQWLRAELRRLRLRLLRRRLCLFSISVLLVCLSLLGFDRGLYWSRVRCALRRRSSGCSLWLGLRLRLLRGRDLVDGRHKRLRGKVLILCLTPLRRLLLVGCVHAPHSRKGAVLLRRLRLRLAGGGG